jgi:penicillin G amidase
MSPEESIRSPAGMPVESHHGATVAKFSCFYHSNGTHLSAMLWTGMPKRILVCSLLLTAIFFSRAIEAAMHGANTRFDVLGLSHPVDILVDPWGVPHVFAANVDDAFFAQGFITARDRLWQIDWARRRELGRLAEVMGPNFVPADQAARLFLDRRDPETLLNAFEPRVRDAARAYVAGINAFIRLTAAKPEMLSPQFALLGYRPEQWTLEDLVRRQQSGIGAIFAKVRRAAMACRNQLDIDALSAPLEPAWATHVPEGLDPCKIKAKDLSLFFRLAQPLPSKPRSVDKQSDKTESSDASSDDVLAGSNAWAIAPRLSTTGRAILANDPHLPISIPSRRYIIHLAAPGLAVAGGSDPGWPGIANGHNDRIAFGRTNFYLNPDDLYVLETSPNHPDSYRRGKSWKRFETVDEEIQVKGAAPVQVKLKFSELGPVISEQPNEHQALAVRSSWMAQPGAATLSQLPYNFASDWPSFLRAIRSYPNGTSFMYADVDGNIGWHAAGWVPVRPKHDGLFPVPGDGRYDWSGLTPLDQLPNAFNPAQGWLANANQMSLPPGFPVAERKIGFDWSPPDRYQRISEVLQQARAFSLEDCVKLQHDTYSERAGRLIPLLLQVRSELRSFEAARAILQTWDRHVDADSQGAVLFEQWWQDLGHDTAKLLVPSAPTLPILDSRVLIAILENPDQHFGSNPVAGRDALLASALDRAVSDLEKSLGRDKSSWSWGRLHSLDLKPPLATRMDAAALKNASIAGGRSGGDHATVMARWYRDLPAANVTGGAAFSMVLDVGEWDNSFVLNMPGQSGDVRSPHYRDLYERWLGGEMFPLLFSRSKIEAVAQERIRLLPAKVDGDR